MSAEDRFTERYKTGEAPWDIGKPDLNLINTVTTTPIQPCKALDIGCGTGDNAIWLAQQGFEVTGIDASEVAIQKAREKAVKANVPCNFLALDILTGHIEMLTPTRNGSALLNGYIGIWQIVACG